MSTPAAMLEASAAQASARATVAGYQLAARLFISAAENWRAKAHFENAERCARLAAAALDRLGDLLARQREQT